MVLSLLPGIRRAQVGTGIGFQPNGPAETHPADGQVAGGATAEDIVDDKFFADGMAARVRKIDARGFTDLAAEPRRFI